MTHVTCCMSPLPFTFHLSLTPPANCSLCMHSSWVCKDPKTQKKCQSAKHHQKNKHLRISRGMPILAIRSLTRSLQYTGKRVFCYGTDRLTTDGHRDIETESAQGVDSVKIHFLEYTRDIFQRKQSLFGKTKNVSVRRFGCVVV